ncbi:MAG: hypothetical protein EHM59_12980 [Betaproteobacteria bacterium]|nr:MAG: hypothetical protein EHM59_12980 [Betaproteobacteria bacterium]
MKHAAWIRQALAVACLIGSAWASAATSIVYQATNLDDTVTGQDRWQYSYLVSGTFSPFDSIWILFDPSRVESFAPVSQPDSSWLTDTVAPTPVIPADGIYMAQTMSGGAVASAPFAVEFVRLDNESPGAQAFEVYDGNFNFLGEGMTSPIPEPRSALLLVAGLLVVAARRVMRQ